MTSISSSSVRRSPVSAPFKRREDLAELIVNWFNKNARDLPWRKTSDPYLIWVSEVMLQQTTVATVIEYYQRFIARFPTLGDLAGAEEPDVLRLWQGLGYYRRAKNLHRGARFIMGELQGKFPQSKEEILKVPGIGNYSAGSILSIAFRQPLAAVDGNLLRVYSRLFAIRAPIDSSETQKLIWDLAQDHVPQRSEWRREFTEGMMELGATICKPSNPLCPSCPVQKLCDAYREDLVSKIPLKLKKVTRRDLSERVWLLKRRHRIAFLPQGADRKFPDFYRLPFQEIENTPSAKPDFRYVVTNRNFKVYLKTEKLPAALKIKIEWKSEAEVSDLLLPTIDRKILKGFPGIFQKS